MINFISGLIIGIGIMCIFQINRLTKMQNRINKAIEYINKYKRIYYVDGSKENMLDEFNILASPKILLEILGGDVDDE